MDTSFTADIRAYRAAAAKRFLAASTSKSTRRTEHKSNSPQTHLPPHQRAQIPGLEEYLQNSAKAYAESKTLTESKQLRASKQPRQAQALGHGEPVEHLHVTLRRERWLRERAVPKQFVPIMRQASLANFVVPCGIPRDVLRKAASQFLLHKKHISETSSKPKQLGNVLGRWLVDEPIEVFGIRGDPGFCAHVERCKELLAAGRSAVVAKSEKMCITCDTFEDVRRRYAGRPDELYRRKTARKFAIWRRERLEEKRMLREHELNAEKEMKRRRGYDRLLSSRSIGDSSFAPFLFEFSNNTYAYSSKITEAPKLRKIMIEKYSAREAENNTGPDHWRQAQHIAETTPLFHTRVMNRFS